MFPTRRTSMRSSSVILAVLTSVTFSPARAQSLHALYNFDVQIGSNGLTMSNGAIVGVTLDVSQSQGAEFYQLVPPAGGSGPWTRTILYQFALKDGRPNSSSLAGAHGEYYGTTSSGGAYNVGEVYQLGPPSSQGASWSLRSLYSFSTTECPSYGCSSTGPPGIDEAGSLYVVAQTAGEVFRLVPPTSPGGTWNKTVLVTLDGTNGDNPNGGLQVSSRNVVYGTTSDGGLYAGGVLFSLTPPQQGEVAWAYTVLHEFGSNNSDGTGPLCGLTLSPAGVLYGTTEGGDPTTDRGTVFSFDTANNAYSVLLYFNGTDGYAPQTPPILGPNGVLYGNSIHGGFQIHTPKKSFGTIYQLTPPAQAGGAWTENTLFEFGGGAEGGYPVGKLAMSPNGTLFGATQAGGANEEGVAFAVVP